MKWPKSLVLVRHGESVFNKLKKDLENDHLWKIFVESYNQDFRSSTTFLLAKKFHAKYKNKFGDRSTPLTDFGISQAIKTGAHLKAQIELPDVILTSPYLRCAQTFEGLKIGWPELKTVEHYNEELIVERDVGLRQLYTHWRIFYVFHPEQREFYDLQGYYDYQFPQGHSMRDVNQRVRQWFDTLVREFAGKNVLVVGHGVTIMGIRTSQERLTPEEFLEIDHNNPPKNCSITTYRCDPKQGRAGKLVLERYNETAPGI